MSDHSSPLDHPTAEGLADLYRRHGRWLKAALRRRSASTDVEDLVQEVWLRVATRESLRSLRHPKALLLQIASNLARDQGRHRRVVAGAARTLAAETRVAADQLESVLLSELILGLPEPLRDVFVLSRFAGMTNDQIAEQLGIASKTVEWRMTKALAHCAAQLRR